MNPNTPLEKYYKCCTLYNFLGVTSSRKRGNQESTETSCISNNVENSSNAQNHDKSSVSKKISSSEPSLSTNEESSTDSIAGGRPKRTRR